MSEVNHSITKSKAILLYGLVSFFLFFEMAVQVSPSVMSTQLMHDLQLSTLGLGIMSGVYFYTYTAMQIPSGLLFDRYNPRMIIVLSILACAFGTLLFAFSTNIYLGSIARMVMGLGSAFAFVSVLVVTADLFKSKYFATMTGITQMLAALGAMTGQMPISALTLNIGWRNTLYVLFVIGLLLAWVVWKMLRYQRVHLVTENHGYANLKSKLKKIVSNRQTWYVAAYACLLWTPMSSFASLWGVPFLTSVYHIESNSAAFLCSLTWLGLAFASPILGIIATALKNNTIPLAVSALVGAVSFGLVLVYDFPPVILAILLFLAGAACAGQALSFTVVKENHDVSERATAIAFNNMAVVISGAIFQPLIGQFIEMGHHGLNNELQFKLSLSVILICYIVSFLIALCLITEPKQSHA